MYLTSPKHYLYDELLDYPPEKIDFVSRRLEISSFKGLNFSQVLGYFRDKTSKNINSHVVLSNESFDLIQSNGSIIYKSGSPWIVDFEDGTAFTFLQNPTEEETQKVRNTLKSEACKKLLPHCEAARESFYNLYSPTKNIREKTEVVYPAFHSPENFNTDTGKTSLLFVAREFERKGGYEAINAFKQLKSEHDDLEFICVSDIPREVREQEIEGVRFYSDVEREKLYKLYREADIFIYPTYHDTFGLVMLEAMAFGNPVITLDAFATNEIVEDGEDGYIVEGYEEKWFERDTKIRIDKYNDWKKLREQHTEAEKARITEELADNASNLIEDQNLLEKMSEKARYKIEEGKFSIKKRNEKLSRIYMEALEEN